MHIRIDDLTGPEVHALLEEHLADMHALSPPESVHALDLSGLRRADITFWTAWEGPQLLGCGALRQLEPAHGEVKSMRTPRFVPCGPFGDYRADPNSFFMTLVL